MGFAEQTDPKTTEIHNNDSFLISVIQYIINFPVSRRCITVFMP